MSQQLTTTAAHEKWRRQEGRTRQTRCLLDDLQHGPAQKLGRTTSLMRKTSSWKRPAAFSRIAFSALLFIVMAAATLHIGARAAQAASSATLSWTAPTTYTDGSALTTLSGFKVFSGTTSGNLTQSTDVGKATSYSFSGLNDSTTYYFEVQAYDATGNTSTFSNQASYTTPTPPPPTPVYTLTASAGNGGSITPSGALVVSQGLSQTYAIAAASGYKIAGVTVDGASVGAVSSYSFSNVAANHTINASFAANSAGYTITASAGAGGTISASGAVAASAGTSPTFTVTPNAGYYVVSVVVDGTTVVSNIPSGGYSYTFSNVSANHTISATFAIRYFWITPSAGSGGTISPAAVARVMYNTSQAVTITPNSGYHVADVQVDGASVGAVSLYTFNNVAADHTIAATFSVNASTPPAQIPHTSWTLKYVDSQELSSQNGAATNAFDGNTGTMWHTVWSNGNPACPHEIQINLGKSYTLSGFSYLPRQDGSMNGTIAKYEFYVSSDGVNWGTAVGTGTFANNTSLKQVTFTAKSGQYIRLRALSEVNGNPWTSAAEINVTGF